MKILITQYLFQKSLPLVILHKKHTLQLNESMFFSVKNIRMSLFKILHELCKNDFDHCQFIHLYCMRVHKTRLPQFL